MEPDYTPMRKRTGMKIPQWNGKTPAAKICSWCENNCVAFGYSGYFRSVGLFREEDGSISNAVWVRCPMCDGTGVQSA